MTNSRKARIRRQRQRRALLTMALVLVTAFACIGGTIAWLTDDTDPVVNTFTVGNIDINLDENTGEEYKMVPGNTIEKDPFVTVEEGSEDAWVFVKIEESENLDDFIDYTVDDAWTALPGVDGVYYLEYTGSAVAEYPVLANDQVTVLNSVTKTMMDAITAGTADEPTLTFTAYAIQKDNVSTASDAWTKLNTPAA